MNLTLRTRILTGFAAVLGVSVVCMGAVRPAIASSCSSSGCSLSTGHYYLDNNWWGVGSGVSGNQTISLNNTNSWSTNWSWSGGSSYSVKTYAEMVDGWNWGGFNGSPFPYQISGGHSVNAWWYFNASQSRTGAQDISWDCFFSPSSNPGYSNPSDEMMVWLAAIDGAGPLGSYKKTVTVDGWSWKVYQGYGSWNVVSYVVAGSNANGFSCNLMDFAKEASNLGYISSSHYFLNVDTGTEVFEGAGSLTTTSYGAP